MNITGSRYAAICFVISAVAALSSMEPGKLMAGQSGQDQNPVAIVNGKAVSDAELSAVTAGQLRQLHLQEYQIRKEGLENLVNQKVMEAAAQRIGIPLDKLLEQEVYSKIGEPSDLEIKAYYLGQKDRLNRPLAEIEQQLRSALRQSRLEQARQEYVTRLREEAGVKLLLRPPKAQVTTDPARLRGELAAPVTIVEFSDYQCPYCQVVEATLKQVLAKYEGRVNLAYRDFPLTPIHPQAQIAAEASRCALDQDKFWVYHDAMFANQSLLQQTDLIETAGKLGLDRNRFESCLTSGKYRNAVQSDYQDGAKAGVTGTPGFFVNGSYLNGNQPLSEFSKLIDDELEALRAQSQLAEPLPRKEVAGKVR